MARDFKRSQRVEGAIRRILGEALGTGVRDPRLFGLTLTHVDVSRDLSVARIYYSLPEEGDAGEVAAGLEAAGGFLRSVVARELQIRKVPELRFRLDETLQRAQELEELIERAVADGAGPESPADEDGA